MSKNTIAIFMIIVFCISHIDDVSSNSIISSLIGSPGFDASAQKSRNWLNQIVHALIARVHALIVKIYAQMTVEFMEDE